MRDLLVDQRISELSVNYYPDGVSDFDFWRIPGGISETTNSSYSAARSWVAPRDPLVLDLDGDGIEAIGINSSRPILFDHDGDGTRNATGWISGDDGIVVLDRNGNGLIDSGRELFGDQTLKPDVGSDGRPQTYANGYEALAGQDSNGDGVINANDAAYSQLRIWRDANQDGISQASELRTLSDSGIASIGVVGAASNLDLGNGNTQPWSGNFTRIDGSTGASGVAEVSGSLLLASNNFYREFPDDPVVTAEAGALPQMGGSGLVRDLREAMSLGGEAAQVLQSSLGQFASANTRDAQMALIDTLLTDWARTSGKLVNSVGSYSMVEGANGRWVTADYVPSAFASAELSITPLGLTESVVTDWGTSTTRLTSAGEQVLRRLNVLEVFNGTKFIEWDRSGANTGAGLGAGAGGGGGSGGASSTVTRLTANLSSAQIDLLNQSYDQLVESVYGALVVQTRLKPYLDSVVLTIDENGVQFDTSGLAALMATARAANERTALIDLVELNRYQGATLAAVGYDGLETLAQWVEAMPATSALRADLAALHVYTDSATAGSSSGDIYLGDASNNSFSGGAGNDILNGGEGDDQLQGNEGNDQLIGGEGADTLYGGAGNDQIAGGEGNDTLAGEAGEDTLEGGAGNDYFSGGEGNDTYLFGRGDGQDTIGYDHGSEAGKHNVLRFKPGVSAADVSVRRSGDTLILAIAGTQDQVSVTYFFNENNPGNAYNPIQQVVFEDGTTWDGEALAALTRIGTQDNDNLTGTDGDDSLEGLAGNDYLYGRLGNDTLNGGEGDDQLQGNEGNDQLIGGEGADTLYGGAGNDQIAGGEGNDTLAGEAGEDTLEGGAGNDYFSGGEGNDTYLFGRGDGQDTIGYDHGSEAGKHNVLRFKPGVSAADVSVRRSGDTLILAIAGTQDQVSVTYFFNENNPGNAYNPIQQVVFEDGTAWDVNTIATISRIGTEGNVNLEGSSADDTLSGLTGNDHLYGRAGSDQLSGGQGDDRLFGGAGNDTLKGGEGRDDLYGGDGDDTYLFGRGDGQDTIFDHSDAAGSDALSFGSEISADQLWFRRVGASLEVSIIGTSDASTITNWYDGAEYQLEQFRTSDGRTLASTQVEALVSAMASFAPLPAGQTTLTPEYRNELSNVIATNWS
ncbi:MULTISPECIES: calcium-binding protein [unclassified Acidovorax]|nr:MULTISPECIES: calcium-binding protein [unclassified Acidovorax]